MAGTSLQQAREQLQEIAAIAVKNKNTLGPDNYQTGMEALARHQAQLKEYQQKFTSLGMLDQQGNFKNKSQWPNDNNTQEREDTLKEYNQFIENENLSPEVESEDANAPKGKTASEAFSNIFNVRNNNTNKSLSQADLNRGIQALVKAERALQAAEKNQTKQNSQAAPQQEAELVAQQEVGVSQKVHAVAGFAAAIADGVARIATLGIADYPFTQALNTVTDHCKSIEDAYKAMKSALKSDDPEKATEAAEQVTEQGEQLYEKTGALADAVDSSGTIGQEGDARQLVEDLQAQRAELQQALNTTSPDNASPQAHAAVDEQADAQQASVSTPGLGTN